MQIVPPGSTVIKIGALMALGSKDHECFSDIYTTIEIPVKDLEAQKMMETSRLHLRNLA